jgi:hypothetical protein
MVGQQRRRSLNSARWRARFPASWTCFAIYMATAAATLEHVSNTLRCAVTSVREVLGNLPDALHEAGPSEVNELVSLFDGLSRASSAGWALAAHRGEQMELPAATGHRGGADWLAEQSGIPLARAKEALLTAERLDAAAPVRDAFLRGDLSMAQAQTIADTLAVVPECGPELLRVSEAGSHRELCRQATRIRQAARSREEDSARRARAFRRRSLRFCQLPEGGVRAQIYLTEEAWGRCLPALEHRANVLFRLGRAAKEHSSRDQYLADALVDLVSGNVPKDDGTSSTRGDVTCIVRVDAAALRRGSIESGEVCEIAGVGPISVDAARELLNESMLRMLVVDGADVTTITGRKRTVPARLEVALLERDPSCVVPKCDVSIGLETHHWQTDVQFNGETCLDNLARICSIHHDLATHGGWRLAGGPGNWDWVPPDWPISGELRRKRRQIAAGRGRSKAG